MKNLKHPVKSTFYAGIFWGLFILFFFNPESYAATQNLVSGSESKEIKEKWVFHSEVKGVKVYYQLTTCENKSVVYLKFDNTNKQPVQIAWKEVFTTKQIPKEQEGYLGKKQLNLKPGITAQSDCGQVLFKECVVFSHQVQPTYVADILKFDIKDIAVTPAT